MKQQYVQSVPTTAADIFLRALTRSPLPLSPARTQPILNTEPSGTGAVLLATGLCLFSALTLLAATRNER
jgi:hypothetical protein